GSTLRTAFHANAIRHPLHLLGRHAQLRQFSQVAAGLLVGRVRHARVDDLDLYRRTVVAPINPQALRLREKKTADNGGSACLAPTIPPRRHGFAPGEAPGLWRSPVVRNSDSSGTAQAADCS